MQFSYMAPELLAGNRCNEKVDICTWAGSHQLLVLLVSSVASGKSMGT